MENLRSVGRIFLGSIIALCGAILLFGWDPSASLPNIFMKLSNKLSFFRYLIPFSLMYFRINAALFLLAGIFIIAKNKFALLCQSIATFMFALTYDNPFLGSNMQEQLQRCVYVMCHGVILSTLIALKHVDTAPDEEKKPEEKKANVGKEKDSEKKIQTEKPKEEEIKKEDKKIEEIIKREDKKIEEKTNKEDKKIEEAPIPDKPKSE
jgi:hypothetical protein